MTENDIIVDMNSCLKEKCEECSRKGKSDCKTGLMQDAITIILFQKKQLATTSEANEKLEDGLRELRASILHELSAKMVFDCVNTIIETIALYHENDEENSGEAYERLIGVVCGLVEYADREGEYDIKICRRGRMPRIEKTKEEKWIVQGEV